MSSAIPEPVTKLIEGFSRLPGVGPKTASRLTYYLLRAADDVSLDLAAALTDLKEKTRFCGICFNITVDDPCPICTSSDRALESIAVVEEPLDLMAIERTGIYKGQYHVLHGAISPVSGVGPDDLKIRELVRRVEKGQTREVIIATNPGHGRRCHRHVFAARTGGLRRIHHTAGPGLAHRRRSRIRRFLDLDARFGRPQRAQLTGCRAM